MINPADLLKIKGAWDTFANNHPKFPLFLNALGKGAIKEGTIIEIHVKQPEGQDICTNIKIKDTDMQLMDILKNMGK